MWTKKSSFLTFLCLPSLPLCILTAGKFHRQKRNRFASCALYYPVWSRLLAFKRSVFVSGACPASVHLCTVIGCSQPREIYKAHWWEHRQHRCCCLCLQALYPIPSPPPLLSPRQENLWCCMYPTLSFHFVHLKCLHIVSKFHFSYPRDVLFRLQSCQAWRALLLLHDKKRHFHYHQSQLLLTAAHLKGKTFAIFKEALDCVIKA